MSSIVRRAELQTISRTTELFSVCCFWIFAHFGQTRNKGTQSVLSAKRLFHLEPLLTLFQIGGQSVCQVITGQEVGVWKMQECRRRTQWNNSSADYKLVKDLRRLTQQFELLLLDQGQLAWEVLHNQVLQVCWAARFWHRRRQDICYGLLFLLVNNI